jgi:uncharacterized iron-regulated membrane protein
LTNPPLPKARDSGAIRTFDEIIAAARHQVSDRARLLSVALDGDAAGPASVTFAGGRRRGPGRARVLIDPRTLDVVTPGPRRNSAMRVIRRIHENLMSGRTGRALVGWTGLAALLLGVSGLILWWPRGGGLQGWKAAFSIRWAAKGLMFHRDLHAAVGFWSLTIFLVVSFTGVYLVFPDATRSAILAVTPAPDRGEAAASRTEPGIDGQPLGLDGAVALALEKIPGSRFRQARLPARPGRPIRISLVRAEHQRGEPVITALVDPRRRSLSAVFDPRDFSLGERIIVWQRALHAGLGLGWTWRTLVFLSGLLPALFAVTGVAMWWIKRRPGPQIDRQGSESAMP